ncbi:ABC transporter permease subunit [Clostridiaceae bacterium HSG29]|nr:ABC transporter permease subunit [Clostridiaceae bacterium HSG29]
MRKQKGRLLLIIPYFLISLLPLGVFFLKGVYEIINSDSKIMSSLVDMRVVVLLLKTVFYSLSVALIVVLFALIIALGLVSMDKRWRKFFVWLLIGFIAVPISIHTVMWMNIVSLINTVIGSKIYLTGWGISVFIQVIAWLPLAIIIIYDSMMKIPMSLMEAGRILSSDRKVFFRIWLPQCKTGLIIVTIGVFVLTFNDYSVPSTFAMSTFAMEIFARYSISLNAGDTFIASLPMIIVGMSLAFPLISSISKQFFSRPSKRNDDFIKTLKFSKKYISKFAIIILFVIILLPLAVLIYGSNFSDFSIVKDGGKEILNTLWICFGATLLATPIMLSAALSIYRNKKWQTSSFLMILLPTLISPSLIGAALINFMNVPLFRWIYLSSGMGMLAVIIRFMPIGILIIIAGLRKIPDDLITVAYMTSKNIKKTLIKVIIPLIMPSILIAASVVFLLGIGEMGTTVMVLPAGISTITVRLMGYLHYGATELIAELSLVVVALLLIFELIIYGVINKWLKNLRRRRDV